MADAEPDPRGRRARKKLRTREALGRAALRLAVDRGVENVTLEQITAEADTSLRTFFNHFSGKEEAVVAAEVATGRSLVEDLVARPPEESVLDALRAAVDAAVERLAPREAAQVAAFRVVRSAPALRPHLLAALEAQETALAAAIRERIATGPDAAGVLYAQLVAAASMATLRVVQQRWLERSEPGPVPRAEIDTLFALLRRGFDHPTPGSVPGDGQ